MWVDMRFENVVSRSCPVVNFIVKGDRIMNTAFSQLETSDLIVDRVYEGGSQGHAGDDPLSKLLPVGNQAGFRYAGSSEEPRL